MAHALASEMLCDEELKILQLLDLLLCLRVGGGFPLLLLLLLQEVVLLLLQQQNSLQERQAGREKEG